MNPVAMPIINPLKKYWLSWGSNQGPPVLKSATVPTELWVDSPEKDNIVGKEAFLYQQIFASFENQIIIMLYANLCKL